MSELKKGSAGTPTRAIIYTRFSPRRAAEECESCAWQRAECEQYASKKGYRIVWVYDDPDISGADAVRPTLWQAIDALKKGDVLLVWKWDRLARDLLLELQIERAVEQRGATVVATTGDMPGNDPQAKFTRHILGAVAELERMMIKQRTSAAMKALQRNGRRMSARVPFGWKVDADDPKRLVEDASEQATRRLILSMREAGDGFRKITTRLNADGVPTRGGAPWQPTTVRCICRRG